jgi:Tfp pilus assembly protein PilF
MVHNGETVMKQTKIHWTPLAVITLFVGLVDSALVIVIPKVAGNIQVALIVFVFLFTFFFFGAFVLFLWKKPHLLYSPSEWGETPKLDEFVQTVSGLSPKQVNAREENAVETTEIVIETPIEQAEELQEEKYDWTELFFKGKYSEARELIHLALNVAENKTQVVFLKTISATALSNIDLYTGAIEFEKVIDEFPNEPHPYRSLAQAYERVGEHVKAIGVLDRGINHVAKENKIILKLDKLYILVKGGKPEHEADIKKIALEIAQPSKEPKQVASAYRLLGLFFAKQSQQDKAKKSLFLAFKSARADRENLEEIANHFRDDIKDYKTELYFRALLVDLAPNDESSLVLLGNCHYILNQRDLAYQRYIKASQVSDNPGAWVYGNIGNLYNTVGLYTLGISTLEKSLKITPDDTYSHERIGSAIANSKKQLEESEKIITAIKDEIANLDPSLDEPEPSIGQQ